MTTHLTDSQIRAYRERSLDAAELLEASRHIGDCEACRTRLAPAGELTGQVRAVKATLAKTNFVHLTYDELEAYVDGLMDTADRVALESHTRGCRSCAGDLAGIQSLRRELQVAPPSRAPRAGWAEFWSALLGWRGGLVAAAAACAIVAFVLVRSPGPRRGEVAQVSTPTPSQPLQAGSVIHDGTRVFTVRGGAVDGLTQLAAADRTMVEQAVAQKRIERGEALADLAANGGVLLGAAGEVTRGKLLQPLTTVVESQRPVFRWQPVAGATYRVSVYDTGYNVVAQSVSLAANEWQPPMPLLRGARFSWQITVRQRGATFTVPMPPAPEARFRVLGEQAEAEISQARGAADGSHLILGILYARAGLLDQAEQELSALRMQNPSSEDVASLLGSLERLRGGGAQQSVNSNPRRSQ